MHPSEAQRTVGGWHGTLAQIAAAASAAEHVAGHLTHTPRAILALPFECCTSGPGIGNLALCQHLCPPVVPGTLELGVSILIGRAPWAG
jgi:hypothetical protein